MMIPRPRYHFTPQQNFMNDPNGLVFYDGEYHLFYQYNPFGDEWGHMSWGHAVSRDLVHWEHRPVALHEEDGIMIFSGSAVIDWKNTSDFGTGDNPPLIAIYTGHSESEQTQNIAYSRDHGRTWTKYAGNPVLATGAREFRDPKVFWHERTGQWIMVTVLADQHKVRFDGSPDLRYWTHLSDFGPEGATDGAWECPDLFPLIIDSQPELMKWVLKVDVWKGTGAQYFIGDFDGTRFSNDATDGRILSVDYGEDFYAAQSWSDEPNGRRIWIGWLNNWRYANTIPTSPWRGAFSIIRVLSLTRTRDGIRLLQRPIPELQPLRGEEYHWQNETIHPGTNLLAFVRGQSLEILADFQITHEVEAFGLRVRVGWDDHTTIGYNVKEGRLYVDRTRSGQANFHDGFAHVHTANLSPIHDTLRLHIFVDSSSVEVFMNNGLVVFTECIFPAEQSDGLELFAEGGHVNLNSLDIYQLKPATFQITGN